MTGIFQSDPTNDTADYQATFVELGTRSDGMGQEASVIPVAFLAVTTRPIVIGQLFTWHSMSRVSAVLFKQWNKSRPKSQRRRLSAIEPLRMTEVAHLADEERD